MEKQLPKNWVETELGNYAILKNGYAFKSNDFQNDGIPVVRISNIRDFKIEIENSTCVDESKLKSDFIVSKGDILIAMSGATTGKYGVFEQDIIALQNQRVGNLKPIVESLSNRRFLLYLLGSLKEEIEEKAYGAAQPNISPKLIESINIYLPPLPEQNRIVTKLDALFAQLETIKSSMANVPLLLKDFRQQVLTQAVTGKLTEEWRKGKELESSEKLIQRIIDKRINDFDLKCKQAKEKGERKPTKILLDKLPEIEPIDINLPTNWFQTNVHFLSFVTKLAGFEYTEHFDLKEDGEIPVVRAQNVQMGRFDDKNRLYMSKKTSDFLVRSQLHGREILMVFIGAGTGNVCLAPKDERWHLAPNVAKIDVDGISTEYLYLYLQSALGIENVLSRVKATAQPSLSMETIREIIALVPPIEEQQEIVSRVESLFAKADAIEKQYESLKAKIDNLPQALLHKAFKGELTEQLESDGDARELLKEIEGLKAVSSKVKKGGKVVKEYEVKDEILGMVAEPK